jgi:hypothetical protein
MFIHGYIPKSKKRKVKQSVQKQHDEWLASVSKPMPTFSRKTSINLSKVGKPFSLSPKVHQRETVFIPSKNPQNMSPCSKPADKVYTGDKMIGIGTLHKSNAVPVFTAEEALDMAKMRR